MEAYCGRCGEKRPERDDWTLQNIAGETFGELINVEHSKLWRTLRLLVARPGQLTREYWDGRRKPSIGPVKLYLVFFALMLVLYSIHQGTAVFDVRTLAAADPNGNLSRTLQQSAAARGVSVSSLAAEVNSRWQNYISMSQLAYPLFVALGLKLLFRRRGLYFAEHLIFALHMLAFLFLSFVILWPFYLLVVARDVNGMVQYAGLYFGITAASLIWTGTYLLLAIRRAYDERWIPALVKGSVVLLIYFATSVVFASLSLMLALNRTQSGG